MRTISRYILLEYCKVGLLTLLGFTSVIILAFLAKESIDEGLGPGTIIRLLPYILPQALQFAVPGTVLLAATNTFGRMSASNEIVALKSVGISPWSVFWPTLALVTLLSFTTVWLNDLGFSWGRNGVERVLLDSLEDIVYARLRTERSYQAGDITISVDAVEGRRLIRPVFTHATGPEDTPTTITAREASLTTDASAGILRLQLIHPQGHGDNGLRFDWADSIEEQLSLADFSDRKGGRTNPSQMPLAAIPDEIDRQQAKAATARQELASLTTLALLAGEPLSESSKVWTHRLSICRAADNKLHRLRAEPHRRWAGGFSCLFFAFVGIPMAVWRRQGEFLGSFFAVFLPILGLYYPLLTVGLDKAKGGDWPPIAIWGSNLAFMIWGLWMMRRVYRY